MHPDDIVAALRRKPFIPFRLHVADGSFFDVRHPELLLVTMRSAFIAIPGDPPGGIPERAVTIAWNGSSRCRGTAAHDLRIARP